MLVAGCRRRTDSPLRIRVSHVFITLALVTAPSWSQTRVDCGAVDSRILALVVRYCALLPQSYDAPDGEHAQRRYPVLYFLHGLGDSEQTLATNSNWRLLDELRNQHRVIDFLVVTPQGEQSFYINSADGRILYSDFFLNEFIPFIENKYRITTGRSGRAISGVSMGGYGALRFAFAHPELFAAVGAQSAALMTHYPAFDSSQVSDPGNRILAAVFGRPIDVQHWDENSPVVLAKRNRAQLQNLAIYFNCGERDDYGFAEGAKALHSVLKKERVPHEYHLYPGDHSSAYFRSHFAETMEFHSRAFERNNPSH